MAKKQIEVQEQEFNVMKVIESKRPDGSVRVQFDFSDCVTMAEQHTAHLSDINYLMSKYKPDDLRAYLDARASYRKEILGVDFSMEPSLQEAKNRVVRLRQAYESLDPSITNQFKNHIEFLKFIDNPENQEKMVRMGLLTKKQIDEVKADPQTTTQEEDKVKPK